MPGSKKPKKSIVSIADVIRTGEKMSTGDQGIIRYFVPEIEISVSALPATTQGGDFYGIIFLGNGRTAIFIGDVAGHDFSSSIPAAEAVKLFDDSRDQLLHPHLFLRDFNRRMFKTLSSIGRFLTAAVCLLDVETNTFSYASAGHPPALFFRREDNSVEQVGKRMLPIGFEPELSFLLIQKEFIPGDRLLLYTDGLSSGRSTGKEEFGIERIEDLMLDTPEDTTGTVKRINDAHTAFCEGSTDMDDCTILCARRVD